MISERFGDRRSTAIGGVGIPVLCGLVGAAVFLPALTAGRLADDFVLAHTVHGATSVLWPFAHNDLGQPAGAGHFYRPVWVLWNLVVDSVSHDPVFAHLGNLALFAVICGEVAVLLRRLVGPLGAITAGLLFALYPNHGESVAWISGNTDLVAGCLGLGAVLAVTALRPTVPKALAAAALTAAAVLAKEVAVVIPVLAAILVWDPDRADAGPDRKPRWHAIAGMAVATAIALIARSLVISGLGGYGSSLTLRRAGGSLASFSVGAFSAPQLEVLHHPLLLGVPLLLAALCAYGIYRGARAGPRGLTIVALKGVVWFLVALLPVLNQPLNLNTSNGDRLLLLPSVGLAITVGALIAMATHRRALVAWAALALAFGISSVVGAFQWRTAGSESRRILNQIAGLAPPGSRLVVLVFPTDYRSAHLFPDGLQEAVQASGRPTVNVTTCAPVQVRRLLPNQVALRPLPQGRWLASTTSDVPFNVSVFGSSTGGGSPLCSTTVPADSPSPALGTALTMQIKPPTRPLARRVYFDGLDMRLAPGS